MFIQLSANDTEYIATADGVIPEEYLPSSRPVYVLHATPINNLPDNEYDIMQDNTSDLSVISGRSFLFVQCIYKDDLSNNSNNFHVFCLDNLKNSRNMEDMWTCFRYQYV